MKAVILAAGFGTRLGSLTKDTPKPMLLLGGKPLLEYLLLQIKRAGITDVAINLHFKPDVIKNYFGDGKKLGLHITYFYESELLGTAGALKPMKAWLDAGSDAAVLVAYGDIFTNQDLSALIQFHREKSAYGTLLVHKSAKSNSTILLDEDNRIRIFEERPYERLALMIRGKSQKQCWVNSGIQILNRNVVNEIIKTNARDLPRGVYARLVHLKHFYGFPLAGERVAIDSPERYAKAQEMVAAGIISNI